VTHQHIAIAIDRLGGGGAQRVAARLMSGWAAEGRELTLITLHEPESDTYPVPESVRRIVIGGAGDSSNALAGLAANALRIWRLRKALKACNATVVLSFLTHMNVLSILATRGLGVRVVVSERSDPRKQNLSAFWRRLREFTFSMADVVTANSRHGVAALADYSGRRPPVAVPNPVEIPTDVAVPDAAHSILGVGRLVELKQHDLTISAFAQTVDAHRGWHLWILGDGPDEARLERCIAALGLGDSVSLAGNVDTPSSYYSAAAIFVLASKYEGMPNALLEAMSHGLACVVPDNLPGALEHVENELTGLVFRAGDSGDLERCLRKLMENPSLRARLGSEARERMKAFSVESVLAQWDAVLLPEPAMVRA
jgi:glycosyltransferase involved in cell wall biosynthesis